VRRRMAPNEEALNRGAQFNCNESVRAPPPPEEEFPALLEELTLWRSRAERLYRKQMPTASAH
jgi:hypothetical protein